MKLSNESLKKLVRGACYFEEIKGYLYLHHYSEEQIEHFKNRDEFWYTRSVLASGIKIEFKTDAEKISFDYYADNVYSDDNTVDIYVDDVAHLVHRLTNGGKSHFECILPSGNKKVTVYFPTDAMIGVKNFTVDGKYKSMKDRKLKLLAIGDSITQGYGAFMSGASYINTLYRKTEFDIMAQGIGGYRYEKGSVTPIEDYIPDRILTALGTNYHNDPAYDYEKNIEEFYAELHDTYGDTPVLSVTPIWRGDENLDKERFFNVITKIYEVCAKYPNITVLDGFTLVPHINECFIDSLHPNAYGCELMAQGIADFMKKIKF